MRIYTRTGDEGETGLFGGGRVPKDHPRVAAYGDVDELNSAHRRGARHRARRASSTPCSSRCSATCSPSAATSPRPIRRRWPRRSRRRSSRQERVAEFERVMDAADEELPPLRAFVLPAGTPKAAALHLARTVCRRAERSVVHLAHESRGARAVRRLPQSPVRPALHAGPPGQPPRRRGRRDVVARGDRARRRHPRARAATRCTSSRACSAGWRRWRPSTWPAPRWR